jgi:diguanylate cyclase (GGDEF)-like protein
VPDSKLGDEPARLAALRRYDVLDTPPEAPFDKLTALVRSVLNVPICAVTLVDAERQWFKSQIGIDVVETPRDVSFCTHTIKQREPLIIEDAKADLRFCDNPLVCGTPFIGSYAGAPLKTPDGYNVGALCVIDTVPRSFEPAQIEILKSFAALVVHELELRQVARRDFLTGVMTRRAFVAEVDRHITLFKEQGRGATLIMFDIDHFKSVNDRFGHAAGDKVLQEVALRASLDLRPEDCIGRLGGEEFAILMSGAHPESALNFAESVRMALEAHPFALDKIPGITASFGIAPLTVETADSADSADWLAAADIALYRAKGEGRNRCIMAEQSPPDDIRRSA